MFRRCHSISRQFTGAKPFKIHICSSLNENKELPISHQEPNFLGECVNGTAKNGSEVTYQCILQTSSYQRSNFWKMETDPQVLKTQNRPKKPQLEIKIKKTQFVHLRLQKLRPDSQINGQEKAALLTRS